MDKRPEKFDAAVSLVGGEITWNGEETLYHSGQTPPTDAELDAELKKLQDAYDAQEYARTRKPLYPDIGDQLDDLYKEGAFSASMTAKIKKVKDDNPKG